MKNAKGKAQKQAARDADVAIKRWEKRTEKIRQQQEKEAAYLRMQQIKAAEERVKKAQKEEEDWTKLWATNANQYGVSGAIVPLQVSSEVTWYEYPAPVESEPDYNQLKAENEALKAKLNEMQKGRESMTPSMEEIVNAPRKITLTGG